MTRFIQEMSTFMEVISLMTNVSKLLFFFMLSFLAGRAADEPLCSP